MAFHAGISAFRCEREPSRSSTRSLSQACHWVAGRESAKGGPARGGSYHMVASRLADAEGVRRQGKLLFGESGGCPSSGSGERQKLNLRLRHDDLGLVRDFYNLPSSTARCAAAICQLIAAKADTAADPSAGRFPFAVRTTVARARAACEMVRGLWALTTVINITGSRQPEKSALIPSAMSSTVAGGWAERLKRPYRAQY